MRAYRRECDICFFWRNTQVNRNFHFINFSQQLSYRRRILFRNNVIFIPFKNCKIVFKDYNRPFSIRANHLSSHKLCVIMSLKTNFERAFQCLSTIDVKVEISVFVSIRKTKYNCLPCKILLIVGTIQKTIDDPLGVDDVSTKTIDLAFNIDFKIDAHFFHGWIILQKVKSKLS